jgi:putative hemolysin
MLRQHRDTSFSTLTYSNPAQPRLKRWVIRAVEATAGRKRYARLYGIWRHDVVPGGERIFGRLLAMIPIGLRVEGFWPPAVPETPLVMLANHPFGIGDGVAMLSLAEEIGRPFRVLLHADLLKVPEMKPFALGVDFSETREAMAANIAVRHEAVRLLKSGTTIVIFPGGGVATAPKGFGRAEDLPWKVFVAKLIQEAGASVLPIHFQGQNSLLFHLISRPAGLAESRNRVARMVANAALTLRLSMLLREFARLSGRTITATAGAVIPWEAMAGMRDRRHLLAFLRKAVMDLAPERPQRPKVVRLIRKPPHHALRSFK